MLNRKHIFEWWIFHLSWTKTVAENPCQPTVLVSLAYGGLTLFTQTNFWWFRRIPDSLVTSHIQAWWLWWPQDFLESAAKMKCHGYVHHVFLKNSIVSFSECAQQIWIIFERKLLDIQQKKTTNLNWKLGPYQFSENFLSFWTLTTGAFSASGPPSYRRELAAGSAAAGRRAGCIFPRIYRSPDGFLYLEQHFNKSCFKQKHESHVLFIVVTPYAPFFPQKNMALFMPSFTCSSSGVTGVICFGLSLE